ncbi:MAG: dihydrolipoamide acyltransferase [Oscillospiraceae bacterium]|jgi:predicted thioesterase|nr:dihydrolipoamide acyltransferase [Oscillospiraceae bacterium]
MIEKVVLKQKVTEDMLAVNVGSGSLRVLATPVICTLFEKASAQLAQKFLPADQTTVGSAISVEHAAPTPLGMTITVTADLTAHEGRTFSFELMAQDEQGVCASGTHTRVAVGSERFQQKADAKLQK